MKLYLFKLTQKCCLLSCLSFLFIGCGKPVNVKEDADRKDEYLLPGSVMIEATRLKDIYAPGEDYVPEEMRSVNGTFVFPKMAKAKVPDSVYVTSGNAANQTAYVYMNLKNNQFDFYCTYKGQASTSMPEANSVEEQKGYTYQFIDCFDEFGATLGLKTGDEFFVDQDHSIEVEVNGADPRVDTQTLTTVDVTWF